MPTDNERREVARRLREIRPCKSGHIKWWEIARALGLKQPAGWFGWEKFEPDSVNRLADLIEPSCDRDVERTCRVESSHVEQEIGDYSYLEVELSCGHAFTWDDGTPPDYCPHCGAKVIGEETGDAD